MGKSIAADQSFVGVRVRGDSRPLIVDYDVGSILVDGEIDVRPASSKNPRPQVMRKRSESKRPSLQAVDRWIMNAKKNEVVFHRNGKFYDCRRINMRVVSSQEYGALYDWRIAEDKLESLKILKVTKKSES
jgi:hypothetical protein